MPGNEFGFDGQLSGGQAQRLAGDGFGHTVNFEEHIGRTNDRDPRFERAFAFAHPSFQRLLGVGFLGENADPHFAVALHIARDGNARGLNLLGIQPAPLEGHQAVLAEGDRMAARGQAGAVAAVHLAVFYSIWNEGHEWLNR